MPVRVFQPRHPHLRVLVVLEVDLLFPQRLQQHNLHQPVVRVLLNVVDDVRAIQQDVRPFRDRLLRENPVWSVAHDGIQWFRYNLNVWFQNNESFIKDVWRQKIVSKP